MKKKPEIDWKLHLRDSEPERLSVIDEHIKERRRIRQRAHQRGVRAKIKAEMEAGK